jgi:hypothetical protein
MVSSWMDRTGCPVHLLSIIFLACHFGLGSPHANFRPAYCSSEESSRHHSRPLLISAHTAVASPTKLAVVEVGIWHRGGKWHRLWHRGRHMASTMASTSTSSVVAWTSGRSSAISESAMNRASPWAAHAKDAISPTAMSAHQSRAEGVVDTAAGAAK